MVPTSSRLTRLAADFLQTEKAQLQCILQEYVSWSKGFGMEFLGVRGYEDSDNPRNIHWNSFAKTGDLATKEFIDEQSYDVTCLVLPSSTWRFGSQARTKLESLFLSLSLLGNLAHEINTHFTIHLGGEMIGSKDHHTPSYFSLFQYLEESIEASSNMLTGPFSPQFVDVASGKIFFVFYTEDLGDGDTEWLSEVSRRSRVVFVRIYDEFETAQSSSFSEDGLFHTSVELSSPIEGIAISNTCRILEVFQDYFAQKSYRKSSRT